ncbi:MAG: alpha/beta fold hydrolase [Hyphomicrobiales bacterium]
MKSVLKACAAILSVAGSAVAEPNVGFDRLDIHADHRSGLIAGGIWSPADRKTYVVPIGGGPVFEPVHAYLGAALPDQKLPLIVMSHGSGSSIDGTAWLAAGLAERGALVLVMNHPGTTSGDSSPRRTVRLSERASDLSAALDYVLADPYFSERIDPERVAALGFSLGGATALGIAGLRFDPEVYKAYCDRFGEAAQDCMFLSRGAVDLENLPPEFSAEMSDTRFTSVVAVDPGFTYAALPQAAAEIRVPVQLVTLGDSFPWFAVDVRTEGSGLVDMLPNVEHAVIPNAQHYSFLPICTENAAQLLVKMGEDPICDDPKGSDRAAVHAASIDAIARFLKL